MCSLIPAYGRDYKSAAAVKKDFQIAPSVTNLERR